MIWSNKLRTYVSLIVNARTLHVLREELPDITEVSGFIGIQWFPAIKSVHVMMCPGDSKVAKVVTTTGARHDLNSVDPVLECLGIGACLELQEHDSSGDPPHAT